MPHTVQKLTPVELLKKGHIFEWRNRQWTVERVTNKVKYATVHVEEAVEPFVIEKYKEVKRSVTEDTPLERFAKYEASMVERWLQCVYRAGEEYLNARGMFQKAFNKDGYTLSSFEIDKFLGAQAKWVVWLEAERALGHKAKAVTGDEIDSSTDNFDWLEHLVDGHVTEVMREWLQNLHRDVWMGRQTWSGKGTANAISEIEIDAKKGLYDHWIQRTDYLDELKKNAGLN